MSKKAELHYQGKVYELPVITGAENENAIDIQRSLIQCKGNAREVCGEVGVGGSEVNVYTKNTIQGGVYRQK